MAYSLEKSATIYTALIRENSAVIYQFQLLPPLEHLADSFSRTGDRAGFLRAADRIETLARAAQPLAATERRRAQIPDAWEKIAAGFERLRDPASARRWYRRALESWAVMEPLSAEFAGRPQRVKGLLARVGQALPNATGPARVAPARRR